MERDIEYGIMNYIYWGYESWGNTCPPENYEQIISAANGLIDAYIFNNSLDMSEPYDASEALRYANEIWYQYCQTDSVNGVSSVWE